MAEQSRVERLAARWEAAHQRGEPLSPAEACVSEPELLGEVEELIRRLSETTVTSGPNEPTKPAPPDVPGYRTLRLLGAGGYGTVWLAEDLNLEPPHELLMVSGVG